MKQIPLLKTVTGTIDTKHYSKAIRQLTEHAKFTYYGKVDLSEQSYTSALLHSNYNSVDYTELMDFNYNTLLSNCVFNLLGLNIGKTLKTVVDIKRTQRKRKPLDPVNIVVVTIQDELNIDIQKWYLAQNT